MAPLMLSAFLKPAEEFFPDWKVPQSEPELRFFFSPNLGFKKKKKKKVDGQGHVSPKLDTLKNISFSMKNDLEVGTPVKPRKDLLFFLGALSFILTRN